MRSSCRRSRCSSRAVELAVDTDQSFTASVVDELSRGLDGDGEFETVVDGSTITYDVDLSKRGAHTIGPLRVVARDLFGFWERSFYYGFSTEVVAYPPVRSLGDDLAGGFAGMTDDREHFDSLREYQRGDALRDVNWKASAKRASGDMVVTRYAGRGSSDRVVVAAEADPSHPDEVAEAAASVAAHLLDAGLAVGVVTHQGSVAPSTGTEHRRHLLDLLARMGRGSLSQSLRDEADVLVTADRSGAHVELAGGRRPYRSLLRNRSPGVTA